MDANTDPSALYGAAVGLLAAIVALVAAFGVDLTQAQTEAILGVATAAGPLVVAYLIRRRAWAPASVELAAEEAYTAGTLGEDLRRPDDLLDVARFADRMGAHR